MRLPPADHLPRPHGAHHELSGDPISSSFIMTVQHLIERCLTFYLDRDDCVKALAKHAGIQPVITITVWKELEKANKEFFEEYFRKRSARRSLNFNRILQDTTNKMSNHGLADQKKGTANSKP